MHSLCVGGRPPGLPLDLPDGKNVRGKDSRPLLPADLPRARQMFTSAEKGLLLITLTLVFGLGFVRLGVSQLFFRSFGLFNIAVDLHEAGAIGAHPGHLVR